MVNAGAEVIVGVLENECSALNNRFFTFHVKQRPYIILKWAQSADRFIAANEDHRTLISNDYSNRLVHKWRSEESAILVGAKTALVDNPSLTTRLWKGANPVRLVVDKQNVLRPESYLLDNSTKTIVFTCNKKADTENTIYELVRGENLLSEMMDALYKRNITSVLVEGGSATLQSFIDAGLWDEARIITNQQLFLRNGVEAPTLSKGKLYAEQTLLNDTIQFWLNQ
jgi:diaminohydroxyphosphoribosylaminopyrimidine deaminase/5-amino-6-(5-phosphoribosylamino)uracil reductase